MMLGDIKRIVFDELAARLGNFVRPSNQPGVNTLLLPRRHRFSSDSDAQASLRFGRGVHIGGFKKLLFGIHFRKDP